MPFGGCPTKYVKSNIKPFVNFSMDGVIVITNLPRILFLFYSFDLSSSPVLISSTDVKHIVTLEFAVP